MQLTRFLKIFFRMKRRSSSSGQLLEELPNNKLQLITAMLPSYKEILICYLSNMEDLKMQNYPTRKVYIKNDAAKKVTSQVIALYAKTRIPIFTEKSITRKILAFCDTDYRGCLKVPINRRFTCPKTLQFKSKLDSTMPFYLPDAETIMIANTIRKAKEEVESIMEEVEFLKNMKTSRTMIFGKKDKKLFDLEKQRALIKERKNLMKINEVQRKTKTAAATTNEVLDFDLDSAVGIDSCYSEPSTSATPRKHRRTKKTGSSAFWHHDVLKNPNVIQEAVRNNISIPALTNITRTLIKATEGDHSKVNLSYTQAYRYRAEKVQTLSQQIKSNWKPSPTLAVHWDGKLMQSLDSRKQEERLPILVSGVNGSKLLGVPVIVQGQEKLKFGEKVATSTKHLLEDWQCADNVKAMVFDTTASNTGLWTAACVKIQEVLGRELLWLACRHHVGEIILSHVWKFIQIETSTSPQIELFQRFKQHFRQFSNVKSNHYDIPKVDMSRKFKGDQIVTLCKDALESGFDRGDYKELVVLTLVYLKSPPHEFKRLNTPGADSKSRWMSKILYCFKIIFLSRHSKGLVLMPGQLEKVKMFVDFVVYCYVPWWLTCSQTASAPVNDIIFLNSIIAYKSVNEGIATTALKAMQSHLWYLTQELTPISLFSDALNEDDKERVRAKMISWREETTSENNSQRRGHAFGKPMFPAVDSSQKLDIVDFVGVESWRIFSILGLCANFMSVPVSSWCSNESYLETKNVINSLRVVNDVAERGVKLCLDFIGQAKSEQKMQHILQVVENSRGRVKDQKKPNETAKSWFLALE